MMLTVGTYFQPFIDTVSRKRDKESDNSLRQVEKTERFELIEENNCITIFILKARNQAGCPEVKQFTNWAECRDCNYVRKRNNSAVCRVNTHNR
jgi:hypothetical protein